MIRVKRFFSISLRSVHFDYVVCIFQNWTVNTIWYGANANVRKIKNTYNKKEINWPTVTTLNGYFIESICNSTETGTVWFYSIFNSIPPFWLRWKSEKTQKTAPRFPQFHSNESMDYCCFFIFIAEKLDLFLFSDRKRCIWYKCTYLHTHSL